MNDAALVNAVKTATKRVIGDLGGVEAAASCCGMGKSQLSDYGNVNSAKVIRADVAVALERIGGQPHITAAMAAAQGYALVMTMPMRARSELAQLLARIGRDSGQLFAIAAHALSHKKPSAKERAALLRELSDLRNAADETMRWLGEDTE